MLIKVKIEVYWTFIEVKLLQSKEYIEQIANFLNDIKKWSPENQREVLINKNNQEITSTQGHVLMLLEESPKTNTELSHKLEISGAAITKAMRGLQKVEPAVVKSIPDENDARINRFELTDYGEKLAEVHREEHQKTLDVYTKVLKEFTPEEQKSISRFLTRLTEEFGL